MSHNSQFLAKLSIAGSEKLLINNMYTELPKRKDTKKGIRKYKRVSKRFKKKLKQWKQKDNLILHALREMANTKKHFLAAEIGNMKSGTLI